MLNEVGFDLDAWDFWWLHNREAYLFLDRSKRSPTTRGGAGEFVEKKRAISDHSLRNRVVPRLLDALKEGDHRLTSGVLLSLGRIGEIPGAGIAETVRSFVGAGNLRVSESACIALGVLARPQDLFLLKELLLDTKAGRRAFDRPKVTRRMRSFAAFSLGMAGRRSDNPDVRRFAVYALMTSFERAQKDSSPDARVATMIALGMVAPGSRQGGDGSASASNEALGRRILDVLLDGREKDEVRAHAPAVLAGIYPELTSALQAEVARVLCTLPYKRTNTAEPIRLGCVQALGRIGDADEDEIDQRIRHVLMQLNGNGRRSVRGLALMSLAQVGSRPGAQQEVAFSAAADVRKYLADRIARARAFERSWAALSLGVFAFRLKEAGRPLQGDELAALRHLRKRGRSAGESAAAALGLGLSGDREAVELLADLEDFPDDDSATHGAWALGLSGSLTGVEVLRDLMHDADHRPQVLEAGALGLAMIGHAAVGVELEELSKECDCLMTHAGVNLALGRVGDESALNPLLDALTNETNTELERSYAAVALGRLADREVRPWSSMISVGLNYRATTATLRGGGGILDLP